MKNHGALLLSLCHAIIFVFLFYKQQLGLNLFIYELLTITAIFFILKKRPVGKVSQIVLAGTLLTGVFMVIHYSIIAIFINICSFYLFTGTLVFPQARSIMTSTALAVTNFFQSFSGFFQDLNSLKTKNKGLKWFFSIVKIGIIPILIIVVFILIYNASNPIFNKGITKISELLNPYFIDFFANLNLTIVLVFIMGLIVSVFSFYQVKNNIIIDLENDANDVKSRIRSKEKNSAFKFFGLKNELKSAQFLLVSLNVLILIVNSIDINWVWFHFEWEGEYLKQFVHEGTYLLILSILISMGIVLFFFRGNLNFYSKNKTLKILSYAWLAQNAVLAISVAIRNFWYIKYFALAYKRIGVLFFLLITLYGIYTIYIKVRDKKTLFYLLSTNKLAIYCVLVFMTFFNWDVIIAKYNFNHYNTSFVHLNFLSDLSYKALPYLDKNMEELKIIHEKQQQLYPFEEEYMSIDVYHEKIQSKKERFIMQWNEKNLKSWNFAEWKAYKKLVH